MNRSIKFRVWDKKEKELFLIDDLYWFEENYVHSFNDDRYVFQQFTGFLDKNNKDVYEGDILGRESEYKCACKVAVEWWTEDNGFDWTGWNFGEADTAEIIGNIFQTPELLNN